MIQLGLIGKNGAGKSAVCAHLVSQGFCAISLSDIVRETAKKLNREATRENLIQTGNELKAEHGPTYLATESYKKAQKTSGNVVFDSIRNTEEANYLKSLGVHLIGIDAPLKIRYDRIHARAHDTDHVDFDTFKQQDELENSGNSSGQNINAAFKLCKSVINNHSDLENLHTQINTLLKEISHATS
jgi:dephospho-CoA kinase